MAEASKDAPKKKSKLPLIIVAAVLFLGAAGGAGWFFTRQHSAPDPQVAAEAKRKAALKARVFVPLDPFTVNLADPKESRMAQIAVVLEVPNAEMAEDIKAVMPNVRSKILLLVSSKMAHDLLSIEGKEQLIREIGDATAVLIGYPPSYKKPVVAPAAENADAEKDSEEPAPAPKKPKPPSIKVNLSQLIVQ